MVGIILVGLIVFVWALTRTSGEEKKAPAKIQNDNVIRCPSCGEKAIVYGDHWECTWCGDFGRC